MTDNNNDNGNCPHDGFSGFDKQTRDAEQPDDEHLILRYTNADGEGGFPGTLHVTTRYSIEHHVFRIQHEVSCDQPTRVNLTHHLYFNLNPCDTNIGNHELRLYSDHYLETTPDGIPTGKILQAEGKHAFHFNKPLLPVIQENGPDNYYVYGSPGEPQLMAELAHPKNGITVTILSDAPGLQVCTGKYIDVANGKEGKHHGPFSGIALEPRPFPDGPRHPSFPATWLKPGEVYRQKTIYSFNCFSVEEDDIF